MKAMNPFIFVVVSIVIVSLFRAKRYFNLFRKRSRKDKNVGNQDRKFGMWMVPSSSQPTFSSFRFDDFRNVDVTASTHRALSRLYFAFVYPFMSTFQAYPLCHVLSLQSILGICL
jgi:hypothetical protein